MNALDKFIRGRRDRAGARYETFGGNIYVTEDGCRRAYYQNEVICSMYLTGRHYRHYCYDITGRLISILINEFKAAGEYNVNFDGSKLSSGVYFYSLIANGAAHTKRMTMIK